MDGEKGRDLRRSSGKRHLRALSGHIAPSLSVLGNTVNGDGVEEEEGLERFKDVRGMWLSSNKGDGEISGSGTTGSGSEGDAGSLTRPPFTIVTTSAHHSRKKPKLQAKALDDCNAIDPAMVPRRLRSAINKRNSQSASPPMSDARKRHQHVSSGSQVSNINGSKKLKQIMSSDPFTKEEEEVAETLSSLASMAILPVPVVHTENGRSSEENSEAKAMSAALAVSKGEDAKSLLPCNINEVTNLSLKEADKAGPSMLEGVTVSGSQKFKPDMNGTAQSATKGTSLISGNEQVDHLTLRDAINPSKCTEASVHLLSGNGSSQPTQFDGPPGHNLENGIWPFGSVTGENKLQSFKPMTDGSLQNVHRQVITPSMQPGLLVAGQGHSAKSSSSKAAMWPDIACTSSSGPSTCKKTPAEKLPPLLVDKKQPWKKCAIHLHISHLIQNHQNIEKRCMFSLPPGKLDVKEGVSSSAQPANGSSVGPRNGITTMAMSGTDCSVIERNLHEPRTHVLVDKRFLQVQQAPASASAGAYPQPKPGCDFSSTSTTVDSNNPGNSVKLHGQFPVPFQVQHHTMFPFPFPHGPYTAAFPDQLAAVANQQMQLQLPHYMSSPLYGSHMVHPGMKHQHQHQHQHHQQQQQQQQMWQAHMAHYRQPKWQNGRPHDSLPPLLPSGQASSAPAAEVPAGAAYHHPPHQHQFLSIPLSMTTPSSNRQQQLDNGGFRPEGPIPMQLLCNVQHM
ncbi:GAF-like domain-containing protein [Dioscorea alata]|uniref:GAF-like domain-containing protein n=2 Tax=Dioscorea alata TaxID=55571 RepID=A0ACB7UVJ0_DIOAL|nr:GAF-like domain-containing protein [Dioscorea alata]KAH7664790.1 GAF-like domain-containing protein [Dioscorea alata]